VNCTKKKIWIKFNKIGVTTINNFLRRLPLLIISVL
jgi:hypothetical protein